MKKRRAVPITRRKAGLLKTVCKKTGISPAVLLSFSIIAVVFSAMTLGYDVSQYRPAHAAVLSLLALPSVILSLAVSSALWLPAQQTFDLLFWPVSAAYWFVLSYGVVSVARLIRKALRNASKVISKLRV